MNKIKKGLKYSVFALCMLMLTIGTAAAVTTTFTNKSVPTMQGYAYLDKKNKLYKGDLGIVWLTKKDPDKVSFSATKVFLDSTVDGWSAAVTVSSKDGCYLVNYIKSYDEGTTMGARFRNANWSLNTNYISGTFDYY